MNPLAESSILANQEILFWVACGAVALGITMLVTAVVVQVRRLGNRRRPAENSAPEPAVSKAEAHRAYARVEKTVAPVIPPRKTRQTDTRDNDRLVVLLSRLEEAAGRLESLAGVGKETTQVEKSQSPGDSALKDEADGVEYVFRAAGG